VEIKIKRARAGGWLTGSALLFLGFFSLALVIANLGRAQTNPPQAVAAPGSGMTEEQVALQRKLGVATAAAQKDPQVEAAFQRAVKALRESDELMYKKIKQIDPALTEVVDQILKAKYPDLGKGK